MNNRIWGAVLALLSVFFGSTYSIFSKFLLQWTIAETLILLSQLFSVIVVLFFFGLVPELKDLCKLNKRQIIGLVIVSLCSSVLGPLLYMKGLVLTSAINAIVTSRLSVLFTGIIAWVMLRERITLQRVMGVILMFVGIFYITTEGFSLGFAVDTGVLLILLAAVFGALSTVSFKKFLRDIKPEMVILVRNTLGVIVFASVIPFVFNVHHEVLVGFQAETWMYFVGFAVIAIVLHQYLWYSALEKLSASLAAAIALMSPIFGIMLASVFLREAVDRYHLRGILLLIGGLSITMIENSEKYIPQTLKRMLTIKRI